MEAPATLTNFQLLKTCSKCGAEKTVDCFSKDKSKKYGINNSCRECRSKDKKKYYEQNKEDCKRRSREWRENNPERHKENYQSYNERNREHQKEYSKWYRENNPDQYRETLKDWRRRNQEYMYEYHKNYRERYRDYVNAYQREYNRERRKRKDVKLAGMMRDLLKRTLRDTKSDSTSNILGYTKEDLESRLEFNFKPGMSWGNYGDVWSIDHSLSIDYLFKKGEDRPHIVNALSNLKPIWVGDNSRKKNKHPSDFQG